MTAVEESNTHDSGEWGVFVARAVQDIRRELGEAAANRVATSLLDQKVEAVDAATEQLNATRGMLERTLMDVAEARRAHERLQADLARMEAGVRDAKVESARLRSDAADVAARKKAEADAAAEADSRRISEAWEEVRRQEADVATRRSELLDLDEHANARLAEIQAAEAEFTQLRNSIEGERAEAQRLVEEAIAKLDATELAREQEQATAKLEAEEVEDTVEDDTVEEDTVDGEVLDLRDDEVDLRRASLDDREAELDEWEAELVIRAQELDRQANAVTPMMPPPTGNVTGWGRRPARTD